MIIYLLKECTDRAVFITAAFKKRKHAIKSMKRLVKKRNQNLREGEHRMVRCNSKVPSYFNNKVEYIVTYLRVEEKSLWSNYE